MTTSHQDPVLFTFGLHAHQPVGNFDHVFEEHLRDVYEPFIARAVADEFFPLSLHISGPLLDWLKSHARGYLDKIGQLASEGHLELLLAGYYEPILPALCPESRARQIHWMQEAVLDLFGVSAKGLWLTERVWEPDLPADLADAGVEFVLVDDRHFVAAGFPRRKLHQPFRTEACGKSVGVFPIDEHLRYLIPFQPPEKTAEYVRELRSQGHRLAIIADDIEKFGGWPGTREWVYERGWLDRFMREVKDMEVRGELRLATFSQALEEVPSGGNAYLPSASYREMEEWSLPPEAYHRIGELKHDLGEERLARGEAPLIRGSHWRNFLVKYSESNRMHKKTLALSALAKERGGSEGVYRAIGRAECNDAYWHGVFGGLYLRHLRDVVWRNLAEAESLLRSGEELSWDRLDLDLDGYEELWLHSGQFSALVSPHRGGAVEELTFFQPGVNLANTLTRRRESYHAAGEASVHQQGETHTDDPSRAPSIHDLEERLRFRELPPVDPQERAMFKERILPGEVTMEHLQKGEYRVIESWAEAGLELRAVEVGEGHNGDTGDSIDRCVDLLLVHPEPKKLEKRIRFFEDGSVEVHLRWSPEGLPSDAWFTTEISLAGPASITSVPTTQEWRFPITTFSKSERGFDATDQGESILLRWPAGEGRAFLRLTGP